MHPRPRHSATCLWFWTWAIVGAVGALGTVSLGPIALGPTILTGAALATSRNRRRSAAGRFAEHIPRVNDTRVERTDREHDGAEEAVLGVEQHLTRVYRKLGVHGRADLPALTAGTASVPG